MQSIRQAIQSFIREEDGASAAEYAILVAVVVGIVTVALNNYTLGAIFTAVSTRVTGCLDGTC